MRNKVGQNVTTRLVCALVLSRLDYCNAVLAGLPDATLAPLQRVLNAAARLVLNLPPVIPLRRLYDNSTGCQSGSELISIFKLCVIVHQTVTGRAPLYLRNLLTFVADRPGRVSLRSASRHDLDLSLIHI